MNGIIFDLDGTLGDTLPLIIEALQDTFARFTGKEYTPAEILDMFGPTEEGVIQRRVPPEDAQAAIDYYVNRYGEMHHKMSVTFPGAIQMLQALQQRGVRLGLVTGKGPRTAAISLQSMGLKPYLETLVFGSNQGGRKPDGIRHVLAEWGLPASQVAYVGDMDSDMEAAREAGVLPLGAAWAKNSTVRTANGVQTFSTIAELQDWLEKN